MQNQTTKRNRSRRENLLPKRRNPAPDRLLRKDFRASRRERSRCCINRKPKIRPFRETLFEAARWPVWTLSPRGQDRPSKLGGLLA
jgi:hypothetical protein